MVKKIILLHLFSCVFILFGCEKKDSEKNDVSTLRIVESTLEKGIASVDLGFYSGTLLLHGMSELALATSDPELLSQTIEIYKKFETKEINGRGSFFSYEVGGGGAALLLYKNKADALSKQVLKAAERMMHEQNRSSEGLLVPDIYREGTDSVFIDCTFGVTALFALCRIAFPTTRLCRFGSI
jgi:hypothetical protein